MRQVGAVLKLGPLANGPQASDAREAQETVCSLKNTTMQITAHPHHAQKKPPVTLAFFLLSYGRFWLKKSIRIDFSGQNCKKSTFFTSKVPIALLKYR